MSAMLIKLIIVILLIALIISLVSGLVFLFKDVGGTRRTLHSLGVRIVLAIALMITISYGFYSGKLEVGAPWDSYKFTAPAQETSPSGD
jgi:hypothetical protein